MGSPATLPLFPLGTVLFPGIALPLHVFEDRYREMVSRCIVANHGFGVVLIRRGWEVGEPAEPYCVGTVARIARVERVPDGRFNLLVVGTNRFRIRHLVPGKPYLQATVDILDDISAPIDLSLTENVRKRFLAYVNALQSTTGRVERAAALPADTSEMSYAVAANLQVGQTEQQRLLEADLEARLTRENELLARETRLVEELGAVVNRRARPLTNLPLN